MVLDRIDYVKDFINYLHFEYSKFLYKERRREGYTPFKIYCSYSWSDRENYLTLTDDYDSLMDSEWLDDIIYEYERNYSIPGCKSIRHGVEQVCFVFDDIVYKISSHEVGETINNFRNNISKQYRKLFCCYEYIETYKGCNIYKQETIESYDCSSKYTPYSNLSDEQQNAINDMEYYINMSDDCVAAIVLENGLDYYIGLCSDMDYAGYRYDIHDSNWGFNKAGLVRIFDPIYEKDYY